MFFRRQSDKQHVDVLMEWGPVPGPLSKRKPYLSLEFNSSNGMFTIYKKHGKAQASILFRETDISCISALQVGPRNAVKLESVSGIHTVVIFDIKADVPSVERWRLESDMTLEYTAPMASDDLHTGLSYLLLPLHVGGESGDLPDLAICRTVLGDFKAEKRAPVKAVNVLNTVFYDIPYLDDITHLARIHDPSVNHTRYAIATAIHQTIAKDDITKGWTRQLSFTHPPYTSLKKSEWYSIAGI